jgi:hypothetical protein
MLEFEFYYDLIDKYVDRSDFELIQMDTDSNFFACSEDSIEKLIKPEMRAEYEKDKYTFLPSESEELHPTFNVDGKRFTMKAYEKRTTCTERDQGDCNSTPGCGVLLRHQIAVEIDDCTVPVCSRGEVLTTHLRSRPLLQRADSSYPGAAVTALSPFGDGEAG